MEMLWTVLIIVLAGTVLASFVVGAVTLLGAACEQGLLGLAAYIALWAFLWPVMLFVCELAGIIVIISWGRVS